MSLTSFTDRPLSVSLRLAAGACGGSYADACIIISGVLSSISSFVWPGDTSDRKRFIEAWVRYGKSVSDANRISVPLLRAHFMKQQANADTSVRAVGDSILHDLTQLRPGAFSLGNASRVLTGDDVDAEESELQIACPNIPRKSLRAFSYPSIFYKHVRSNLVHEGELGESATVHKMTTREAGVSYENVLLGPHTDPVDARWRTRRIHFDVEWLAKLARTIAANADAALANGAVEQPATWWLDG